MFTADDARKGHDGNLDARIRDAVSDPVGGNGAYLRIYHDDPFASRIKDELEKRGFINVYVPDFVLKTDVYFEWEDR